MLSVLIGIAAAAALGGTAAAQEKKCSAKYSQEEHLIVEWAALGGDPHAQFAIAQCAAPAGVDLSDVEEIYALKWLTLAACDAGGTRAGEERDRLTRKLKYQSDISFRRFGGITEEERWTAREKKLIAWRREQAKDLGDRLEALKKRMSEGQRAEAREALADQLSRMGGPGLIRLADLTSCKAFAASKPLAAAAYAAAADAWSASPFNVVYGKSVHAAEPALRARELMASLSPSEQRAADLVKARLLRTEPASLAAMEEKAALGRLQEFAAQHTGEAPSLFAGRSVLAAQYALEALGFMKFVNGPDNDYGPSTIEAVGKAQAHYGRDETRWLSHAELRELLCDAATLKSDPISYFHLGVMFAEGQGFPQDLDRAAYAIGRADELLIAQLANADGLPDWKRRHYPTFRPQIERARELLAAVRAADGDVKIKVTNENLCAMR